MKQPVDSLFHKKLKNFQVEAPSSAWDRIDSNLGKQKSPFFWIRIAASLLILFVVGYSIFSTRTKTALPIAAVEETEPKEKLTTIVETQANLPTQEIDQKQEVQQSLLASENSNKKINTSTTSPKLVAPQQIETPENTFTENVLIAGNTTIEAAPLPDEKKYEPINTTTILISSEEANAKYLNEPFIADATPENKKSSKLRDLFEKAQDMDPIGEIRQLKNEVLALNFKSEKKGERNR